jgi:glycosyltransferase involved in cell wall biosynthesis
MLLSIIIPTKNRYDCLKYLVEVLYNINDNDFEVIIQDKSDNNTEFMKFIQPFLCNKIKYFYCPEKLSMSENSDKALLNSSGEYVCFIGDDDGVSSKIVNLVRWMKENNIDSCAGKICIYSWPDVQFKYTWLNEHSLLIPKAKGIFYKVLPDEALIQCLKIGATSLGNMPHVYHGIVSRAALDLVYKKAATFFPGGSPDISNAAALCFTVKTHYRIDTPYIIGGGCYNSGFGMGMRGEVTQKRGIDDNWELKMPRMVTDTSIFGDAAIKAIRNMGKEEYLSELNYSCLYAAMFMESPKYWKFIKPMLHDMKAYKNFLTACIKPFFLLCIVFIIKFLRRNLHIEHKIVYRNVPTIKEAITLLDKHIPDTFGANSREH